MSHGITLALVQQANAIARTYHPAFYCSLNEILADQPDAGRYYRRAVKVWFSHGQHLLNIVYCDNDGDDEALLNELHKGLNAWADTETPPEDSLYLTEAEATNLLNLVSHSLTVPSDRFALLKKFMSWHTRKEGRALAADLTAKIEARSPGVLTGRSWMPHGKAEPRPSPPLAA